MISSLLDSATVLSRLRSRSFRSRTKRYAGVQITRASEFARWFRADRERVARALVRFPARTTLCAYLFYLPLPLSLPPSSRSPRFFHSPFLPLFFLSPQRSELSRDESRRWFQSADPRKSPPGSLTPSGAFRESRSGKRKNGELRWPERGEPGEGNAAERIEVYSISILSPTRATLSQYRPVHRHHD